MEDGSCVVHNLHMTNTDKGVHRVARDHELCPLDWTENRDNCLRSAEERLVRAVPTVVRPEELTRVSSCLMDLLENEPGFMCARQGCH